MVHVRYTFQILWNTSARNQCVRLDRRELSFWRIKCGTISLQETIWWRTQRKDDEYWDDTVGTEIWRKEAPECVWYEGILMYAREEMSLGSPGIKNDIFSSMAGRVLGNSCVPCIVWVCCKTEWMKSVWCEVTYRSYVPVVEMEANNSSKLLYNTNHTSSVFWRNLVIQNCQLDHMSFQNKRHSL